MKAAIFYIFYALTWLLALLPMRVLYVISDIIFLLVCYFPGYRKKTVRTNLQNSFPEKSERERRSIKRKFYRHLSDFIIEMLALRNLRPEKLRKRCTLSNTEILDRLFAEKRDVIAILAHYNNWEWYNFIPFELKHKFVIIYKPLQDKRFDSYVNRYRSIHGIMLSSMSNVIRDVIELRSKKTPFIANIIADQTPAAGDIRYWTTFLNQDTPVYTGAEKIAAKYDMAMVFFHISKTGRGRYNLNVEPLFEHTAGLPLHTITDAHVKHLENIIRERPEYWLWTHRRWKRKRPVQDA